MQLNSSEYTLFTSYYEQYKDKVFSFFYYRLDADTPLAEDLTSDTFLKAFDRFETYQDKYAFSTWIYRIARNTLIDHFRTNKREEPEESEELEKVASKEDFTLEVDRKLKQKEIEIALSKIPGNQREAVILKYLEELETKEIAEILDTSQANVRKLLSRGISALRASFVSLLIAIILLIP